MFNVHIQSMQNDSGCVGSGQVRVFNVHIQSMQNDLGRVGSGRVGSHQVRSDCLTCTFRACRMIWVGSGLVRSGQSV